MIQNIFAGRAKFCFSISRHSDSDILGLFNEFCNPMWSFASNGLRNIIFFPAVPIVSIYSEFSVLLRKQYSEIRFQINISIGAYFTYVTRRISLSLGLGSKLLRGLKIFDFINSLVAITHGFRYACL